MKLQVPFVQLPVHFDADLLAREIAEFDESAFVLDYWAPPGASLEETDHMLHHVEELLMKTPEIESYSRRTGLEMGLFVTEPNRGDYAVKLKPGHKRDTDEVISELRKKIEKSEPALEIEFVGILPDDVFLSLTGHVAVNVCDPLNTVMETVNWPDLVKVCVTVLPLTLDDPSWKFQVKV